LEGGLTPKFLHRFKGNIWNLLASDRFLLIEVRDAGIKEVSFSLLDTAKDLFLWKDKVLEEPWWVNASAILGDKLVFTIYIDTNNPDKKGILVYSAGDLVLKWWNNDFSLSETGEDFVKGFTSKLGLKETVLELSSGKIKEEGSYHAEPSRLVLRPVQYVEGIPYFETVRKFLADRLNFLAVSALEYLEAKDRIIISAYTAEDDGLANYLFVLSAEGNVLLKEKLGGPLKGIGLDTFFILKGCVIFVRNRVELVSYKII
jgi:hypothetical protein